MSNNISMVMIFSFQNNLFAPRAPRRSLLTPDICHTVNLQSLSTFIEKTYVCVCASESIISFKMFARCQKCSIIFITFMRFTRKNSIIPPCCSQCVLHAAGICADILKWLQSAKVRGSCPLPGFYPALSSLLMGHRGLGG